MDDLDSFRWILLAIGILVILAVYVFGRVSKFTEHDSDRIIYAEATETEAAEDLESHEDASAEPVKVSDKIISIYLVSESGSHFSGSDIMRAAKSTDLVLGENDIFHKNTDIDGRSVSVFSVANIAEPGTFNADEMYRFTTRGLAFFLVLPVDIDGSQAFEMLIETADQLKKILNGVLMSQDKTPLTVEKIQKMREEVQEFTD